ncbi:hypothetical protein GCM10027059_45690 [Myceligenerans halotolerans]
MSGDVTALDRDGGRGDRFAISYKLDGLGCESQDRVTIFDLELDEVTMATDMSKVRPPSVASDVAIDVGVEDLWIDLRGHLHASISSWTCGDVEAERSHESMGIWRLEGSVWVRSKFPPAAMMEQLDVNTYLRLEKRDCFGDESVTSWAIECNIGTLNIRRGDSESKIADGVISVYVPPR